MEKKLIFLNHIMNQSEESLAMQMLLEQEEKGYLGLAQECKQFYLEPGILDQFEIKMTEKEWKPIVKKAILNANEKHLKNEKYVKYKKLKNSELMVGEEFARKAYINNSSF